MIETVTPGFSGRPPDPWERDRSETKRLMQPDDEVCLCFHVTRRKLENWIRLEQPQRAGQLSECFGAGTGCGWCRPFLKRLFQAYAEKQSHAPSEALDSVPSESETHPLPDSTAYSAARQAYISAGKGKPPAG